MRSKESLEILINRRIERLRLLALETEHEFHRERRAKPWNVRFEELVQQALARRRRRGMEPQ